MYRFFATRIIPFRIELRKIQIGELQQNAEFECKEVELK